MIEQAKEIAELLKVLANENRLIIVCYLLNEPLNVSQLHERMTHLTQPALSQHLAILKANRILKSDKEGLTITYSILDNRIGNLIGVIKENYCCDNCK